MTSVLALLATLAASPGIGTEHISLDGALICISNTLTSDQLDSLAVQYAAGQLGVNEEESVWQAYISGVVRCGQQSGWTSDQRSHIMSAFLSYVAIERIIRQMNEQTLSRAKLLRSMASLQPADVLALEAPPFGEAPFTNLVRALEAEDVDMNGLIDRQFSNDDRSERFIILVMRASHYAQAARQLGR